MKHYLLFALISFVPLISYSQIDLNFDCSTDFFTINSNKIIEKWSLIDGTIGDSEAILIAKGLSLAFCGEIGSPTFYTSNLDKAGIWYYDKNGDWTKIPIATGFTNAGGHQLDQYFMTTVGGINKILVHYDGVNFTNIVTLDEEEFRGADVAVNTEGHAYVFQGVQSGEASSLNVYDSSGLIESYETEFNSIGIYGSFFLNETLYLGMSQSAINPNSITPVIISDNIATLGEPISFPNADFADMASCQFSFGTTNTLNNNTLNPYITIYPNPTFGILNIKTEIDIHLCQIFTFDGKLILQTHRTEDIDLSNMTSGIYKMKFITSTGNISKTFIKQ